MSKLALTSIAEHPDNPRFDLGDLTWLTEDIKTRGVLQPILVTPGSHRKATGRCGSCDQVTPRHSTGVLDAHDTDGAPCPGGFELAADEWVVIAGHRRRAAAIAAGLRDIECVIRADLKAPADVHAAMLVENVHRRALTPLEEAVGYDQLVLDLGTVDRVAAAVSLPKAHVARRRRLLDLEPGALAALKAGNITLDDAHDLLGLPPESQARVVRSIGTKHFRDAVAAEVIGSTDPRAVAAHLRAEFLSPFMTGSRKVRGEDATRFRHKAVGVLAGALPKRTVTTWRDLLGVEDGDTLDGIDPDRALLALAVTLEQDPAGLYDLLTPLGYELSPVEVELLEGA